MSVRLPFPAVLDRYEMDDLVAILGAGCDDPPGRRTIERWITQGVPANRADLVAIRLHFHPDELWPHEGPHDDPLIPKSRRRRKPVDDDYSDLVPANERNPR